LWGFGGVGKGRGKTATSEWREKEERQEGRPLWKSGEDSPRGDPALGGGREKGGKRKVLYIPEAKTNENE